ncbi:Multidrug resistance efflux pump [Devosia sp. YR412]|uniref:HlyD family secretion protein n=1 Tax=Devosia sp. YR412 TaxID=1881030 RepID=UPI0008C27CCD|nr:HlyD family secretion protein [Devosia sp. YR412]SEP72605.1 Multidrug resistance efflux pump [Devosia sp. YR412]
MTKSASLRQQPDLESAPISSSPTISLAPVADPEPVSEPVKRRNPAALAGLVILIALSGFGAWYVLSDRAAPYAGGASVTAFVTQIAPRVSGPVTQVLVSDNAVVKAGQPLFHIDDTTFVMDVAQAEAQLAQARQTVTANAAAIVAATAQRDKANAQLALVQPARDRALQLFGRGLVSDAKRDQAEADYSAALAATSAAEADIARLTAQAGPSGEDNPQVRTAMAALEKAQFALANTTVLAPADGYITNLSLAGGQFATAGQAVMTFIDPTTQAVLADFRENQLVNVLPGDPVELSFEAAPGTIFHGHVDSIAWGINSGRTTVNGLAQSSTDTRWFPAARKIPVRVSLDQDTPMPANLRLGSEASMVIYPAGQSGVVATMAAGLMRIGSFFSGFN